MKHLTKLTGLGKTVARWSIVALFAVSLSLYAQIAEKDPAQQVKLVSEQLMQTLEKERTQLEQDSTKVQALAERLVFPYVDVTKMARFVMGAHWRSASPEEQKAFVDAFKKLLINAYARSFLKLQIDHLAMGEVRQGSSGKGDVEVPVTVVEKSGNAVPVIFRLLPTGDSWKVYDLEIQGISLLLNYRTVYALEIESKGLPAVIANMQAQAKSL